MRTLIVNESVSLDGVARAPGLADEDRSGGFAHGGWHMRYMEDEQAAAARRRPGHEHWCNPRDLRTDGVKVSVQWPS
jgi:hypothetical protein